jgi:hypothetical protein
MHVILSYEENETPDIVGLPEDARILTLDLVEMSCLLEYVGIGCSEEDFYPVKRKLEEVEVFANEVAEFKDSQLKRSLLDVITYFLQYVNSELRYNFEGQEEELKNLGYVPSKYIV